MIIIIIERTEAKEEEKKNRRKSRALHCGVFRRGKKCKVGTHRKHRNETSDVSPQDFYLTRDQLVNG